MTRADFFSALHTLAPGSAPEAARGWLDFAAENVDMKQYAAFRSSGDRETDVERWLDAICGGIYAAWEKHGAEIAGKLAGLSLENCCLYPGEMPQAAERLRDGGNAKTVQNGLESGEIGGEPPFFPVPLYPLTGRDCGPEILIRDREVPCGMADQRLEPGYVLWSGTVLLESERDESGCYQAVGMDGTYRQAPELYRPVYTDDGRLWAFRQVRPAPVNYLATVETGREQNCNQIDGIINNEAPKPVVEASENEALYLVGGTAYLHIQTSEDEREYTRDDCFTTYDYTLYDKETMRQMDEGRMEVAADIRDTPSQIHRLAAQNILECRTLLGASSIEPVSMDVLETIRAATVAIAKGEAPKPSLLDNLRRCREEAGRSQGGTAPPSPGRDPER